MANDSLSPDEPVAPLAAGSKGEPAAPPAPTPEGDPAAPLALVPEGGALDANGFDPAAFDWIPVLRRPRKDGWTQQRQVDFIAALADCGVVEQAAAAVCMSVKSCYRLRRAPGADNFAAAWDAAIVNASRRLLDLAFDRAINGSDEPVYDSEGRRTGRRMKTNDRLLMFLLRAYMPDRFRPRDHDPKLIDHSTQLALAPMSEALARLDPVAPADPALLMAPDDLAAAYDIAGLLDGKVPHWVRGHGDREPNEPLPVNAAFEEALERAKAEADGRPYVARPAPPPAEPEDPSVRAWD